MLSVPPYSTRFLKYVLHLWYSLMTISILVFQHLPSAAVACRRKREMGNKPMSITPSIKKESVEETYN